MTDSIFRGIATALITPFRNGEVDYDTFGRLIDWQIENGIDALSHLRYHRRGLDPFRRGAQGVHARFAVERAAGRTVIIAGTGSNDTNYAINLTKYSCDVGADAMLVVTPYYNKATQRGLVESFYAIADASTKPMIVYNVPSRTGCNIQPQNLSGSWRSMRISGASRKPMAISPALSRPSRCCGASWTSTPAMTISSCRSWPWAAQGAFRSSRT